MNKYKVDCIDVRNGHVLETVIVEAVPNGWEILATKEFIKLRPSWADKLVYVTFSKKERI